MCGKSPGTLALFAVLGPVRPRTIKPFLPPFLSRRHSREKRYQALSRFTVLEAMESWAGPGNEANSAVFPMDYVSVLVITSEEKVVYVVNSHSCLLLTSMSDVRLSCM